MSEAVELKPKSLLELKLRDCRWVCEEPSEANGNQWMYCGARSKSETCAYCEEHHKIMFEPPRAKGERRRNMQNRRI